MPMPERLTITVSTGGKVVPPKAIRQALQSEVGTRRVVEIMPEGVLSKATPDFIEIRSAIVPGCLSFRGVPRTPAQTEAGVFAEAERRHAHG